MLHFQHRVFNTEDAAYQGFSFFLFSVIDFAALNFAKDAKKFIFLSDCVLNKVKKLKFFEKNFFKNKNNRKDISKW